jgi:mercuric ion binding protein
MKSLKIISLSALLFIGMQVSAQDAALTKESFKVWGNCDMCKKTIEKAANSVEGVNSAKWSTSSKKMNVKYDADKTSLEVIQNAIVASGYDIEGQKAEDEAYNNLHKCCQYDRN